MSELDLREHQTGSELLFNGKILHLYHDSVALPNGSSASRELVRHVGAVCVLPITDDGCAVMERQYRYPVDRVLLEIPAGKLDEGEDPVTGALRELEEETGAVPDSLLPLGVILPAPGCYGEKLHLFLARGLRMKDQHLDPDEFLNVERIPFSEMVHRVMDGEIEDAKTIAAVLKAKILLDL